MSYRNLLAQGPFIDSAFPPQVSGFGGTEYTLKLLGFSDVQDGPIVPDFISEEGHSNKAFLYGRITAEFKTKDCGRPRPAPGLVKLRPSRPATP